MMYIMYVYIYISRYMYIVILYILVVHAQEIEVVPCLIIMKLNCRNNIFDASVRHKHI